MTSYGTTSNPEAQQPLLVKGKASILVSHPFDEAE